MVPLSAQPCCVYSLFGSIGISEGEGSIRHAPPRPRAEGRKKGRDRFGSARRDQADIEIGLAPQPLPFPAIAALLSRCRPPPPCHCFPTLSLPPKQSLTLLSYPLAAALPSPVRTNSHPCHCRPHHSWHCQPPTPATPFTAQPPSALFTPLHTLLHTFQNTHTSTLVLANVHRVQTTAPGGTRRAESREPKAALGRSPRTRACSRDPPRRQVSRLGAQGANSPTAPQGVMHDSCREYTRDARYPLLDAYIGAWRCIHRRCIHKSMEMHT